MSDTASTPLPLAGIRIVELARGGAVAAACAFLCDLGADVVKVEPLGGDPRRHLRLPWDEGTGEPAPVFELDNRGKRSLALAWETEGGLALLGDLAAGADVFATDLPLADQERHGLSAQVLAARNGRLVHATVSPYGLRGPEAGRPGREEHAFWARSGIMGMLGEPTDPPPMIAPGMGDHMTSINLVTATMAAIRQRDTAGAGVQGDVSLLGSGMWMLSGDTAATLVAGKTAPRGARDKALNPFRNHYRARDGRWLFLVMPQPKAYWERLCRALGRPEWLDAERWGTFEQRMERNEELVAELGEIFGSRDFAEWRERLDAERLIWAPVAQLPQVVEDPQLRAMDYFRPVPRPDGSQAFTVAPPVHIAGADIGPRGPAPALGAHTAEILAELGRTAEQTAALRAAGVLPPA